MTDYKYCTVDRTILHFKLKLAKIYMFVPIHYIPTPIYYDACIKLNHGYYSIMRYKNLYRIRRWYRSSHMKQRRNLWALAEVKIISHNIIVVVVVILLSIIFIIKLYGWWLLHKKPQCRHEYRTKTKLNVCLRF